MTLKNLAAACLLAAAMAAVTGCSDRKADAPAAVAGKKPAAKGDVHAPHGKGPTGGVVFDLGKGHAEFTVDHAKKECAVLFVDGDGEDALPLPVAATELTLTTKAAKTKDGKVVPPMTVKLLPADAKGGKASKFVGTDPDLGTVADFAGTVTAVVGGKPSSGEFSE